MPRIKGDLWYSFVFCFIIYQNWMDIYRLTFRKTLMQKSPFYLAIRNIVSMSSMSRTLKLPIVLLLW